MGRKQMHHWLSMKLQYLVLLTLCFVYNLLQVPITTNTLYGFLFWQFDTLASADVISMSDNITDFGINKINISICSSGLSSIGQYDSS